MKKFLAVLLCICMMASLCVIGVGAETQSSTSTAPAAATYTSAQFLALAENGTITLNQDTNLSEMVDVTSDLIIDLNHYSLVRADNQKTAFQVRNNATLTINGYADFANNKSYGQVHGTICVGKATNDNGNLVINGGDYSSTVSGEAAVQTNGTCKNCTVNANGAMFDSSDDTFYLAGGGTYNLKYCYVSGYTGVYMKGGSLTLVGTTINAKGTFANPVANGNGASTTGDGVILDAKSGYFGNMNLTVTDNTIIKSSNGFGIRETYTDSTGTATHSINISSGRIMGVKGAISVSNYFKTAVQAGKSSISVTGGYFTSDPSAFVPKNAGVVCSKFSEKYDGSTHDIYKIGVPVAFVGQNGYAAVQSAIDSTTDNTDTTIAVKGVPDEDGNYGISEDFYVPSSKKVTLDFGNNGSYVTDSASATDISSNSLTDKSGDVSITNSGELTLKGYSYINGNCAVNNTGTLTIAANTDNDPSAIQCEGNVSIVNNANGTAKIYDGFFKGSITNNNSTLDSLLIYGGCYRDNPTPYLAAGKMVTQSKYSDMPFLVSAVPENVEVSVAAPEVNDIPANSSVKDADMQALKDAAKGVATAPTDAGLPAAAGDATETIIDDKGNIQDTIQKKATEEFATANINTTGQTITYVVQPKLDVTPINYDSTANELTLNIKAKYDVVATTATDPKNINLVNSGAVQNAVVVSENNTLTVDSGTPVVIKIAIPAAMAGEPTSGVYNPLTIKHVKDDGTIYYYTAAVTKEENIYYATFTDTHGFSTFTLMAADTRTLTIEYIDNKWEETYKISDVGSSLDSLYPSNSNFTGWGFQGVSGSYTTLTGQLWDALMTGKTGNQTVTATAQFTAPIGGGSTAAKTYTVTVDKADNGTVTASAASAEAGKTVTLTVAPAAGYTLDTLTVKDASGAAVTVAKSGDNACTFTMPASNVTVTAAFKKAAAPEWKNPFTDVADNAWYYNAVKTASQANIIKGTSDTTFSPDQMITRQEMWMILCRMSGQTPASMAEARTLVMAAKISDGTNPTGTITREQFATMLFRYAKLMGLDTTQGGMAVKEFSDYGKISGFALEAMTWAVNAGLMNGYNNMLMPGAGTSRGQAVVILVRAYSSIIK
jgi:hypothetical protein